MSSVQWTGQRSKRLRAGGERGAAAVEFAIVLPILIVLIFGIIDFGLFFYNDLLLTQAARDAARFASVGDAAQANAVIDTLGGTLVSTTVTARNVDIADHAEGALTGTYQTLPPLPRCVGIGNTMNTTATARMRRE